jgi:hypothetical protein
MRRRAAHHRDDQRRARQPIALEADLVLGRLRVVRLEDIGDRLAGLEARLAGKHDEAPRRELAVVRDP